MKLKIKMKRGWHSVGPPFGIVTQFDGGLGPILESKIAMDLSRNYK